MLNTHAHKWTKSVVAENQIESGLRIRLIFHNSFKTLPSLAELAHLHEGNADVTQDHEPNGYEFGFG